MGHLDMRLSSEGQGSNTDRSQERSRSHSDCRSHRSHSDSRSHRSSNGSERVESCEGCWGGSDWSWSNSDGSGDRRWGQGEGQRSRGRTEELSGLSGSVLFPPDDPPLALGQRSPLAMHHLATIATHSDHVTEAGGGSGGQVSHCTGQPQVDKLKHSQSAGGNMTG